MEKYGHVLVKAFAESMDGSSLEAVMVNYKALHHQASQPFVVFRSLIFVLPTSFDVLRINNCRIFT